MTPFLCVCVFVLCFSVLLVAMVLSPHAVPVVSSLWIRGWRDAEPQRARFRFLGRWSPPVVRGEGGPLFHWTCRKCRSSSSSIVTTRAPENTRSSNDGDGSGGGGGSNGSVFQKTFPTLVFSSSLFLFRSDSLSLSLSSSLGSTLAPSLPIDLSALRARW